MPKPFPGRTPECRPGNQRRQLPRRPGHTHFYGAPQWRPAAAAARRGVCSLPAGELNLSALAPLTLYAWARLPACLLVFEAFWDGPASSCSFVGCHPFPACHWTAAIPATPAGAQHRPLGPRQRWPRQRRRPERQQPRRAIWQRPQLRLRPRHHGRPSAAPWPPRGRLLRGQPAWRLRPAARGRGALVCPAPRWRCRRPGCARSRGARHCRLPSRHLLPSGEAARLGTMLSRGRERGSESSLS